MYEGKVYATSLRSFLDTQKEFILAGVPLSHIFIEGECHFDSSCNKIISKFLESDCTDLVFVDSDEGWKGSDLLRLVSYNRDVVVGSVPRKADEETHNVLIESNEIWADKDGLVECWAVGSGFMRLSRKVCQALFDSNEKYVDDGVNCAMIRERKVIGGRLWGGDYVLSMKARKLGFKLYVDPEMSFEHVGPHYWRGNLGEFWRKSAGGAT